jgi:hypothetical protein
MLEMVSSIVQYTYACTRDYCNANQSFLRKVQQIIVPFIPSSSI